MSSKIAVISVVCSLIQSSVAIKTHFVYWNTSNPIFQLDNTEHIVDVNYGNLAWEYDQLHLVCPQSDEQHVIYSVSKEEFQSCRVTSPRPKIVAICNQSDKLQYFTITFRTFSPTPGGMEFKPGQSYYLISTSTTRDLHRRVGGYCSESNMKMEFKVAEKQDHNSVNTDQRMRYRSPLYKALMSSTTKRPSVSAASSTSLPVYYYPSRTPTVRQTSDYIYYYSPRDLVQLKMAAKKKNNYRNLYNKHRMSDNEVESYRSARLTSSSVGHLASCWVILTLLLASSVRILH